ncbi:MAG: hypothetical protein ACYDCO_01750 [Armatimonadota bacterium]
MRSIRELARRAAILNGGGADAQGKYEIYVEEAWREFVHQVGGVYTRTSVLPLSLTAQTFALPARLREIAEHGVYLSYQPRDIASIARVADTVTVETTTDHGLEVGMSVGIDDVTPVGTSTFDGAPFVVLTVPDTTHFTYTDDDDDDTGAGGQVVCAYDAKPLTPRYHVEDSNPAYYTTQGSPAEYYFPDAVNLAVCPLTDGSYPELFIVYDAEEEAALNLDTALSPQEFVEPGLLDYAQERMEGAKAHEARLVSGFQTAVNDWKAARSVRENVHRYGEEW